MKSIPKLSDKSWTPATVIADLDPTEIEHMVVVAKYKDGTLDTVGSFMPMPMLACLSMVLQRRILQEMDRAAAGGLG
jgi:hypothetical protein